MSKQCPPLTDSELDLAFSEGAADVEIEANLTSSAIQSDVCRASASAGAY
jgi:hypothetical protein